jgi:hypothetical protein
VGLVKGIDSVKAGVCAYLHTYMKVLEYMELKVTHYISSPRRNVMCDVESQFANSCGNKVIKKGTG